MKTKGGRFKTLEDALRKLQEDSPFFVKTNGITLGGLVVDSEGRIEVTARRCLAQGGMGVWGLKALRGVALETQTVERFRPDDHEYTYSTRYFLKDYRIDPSAPALPVSNKTKPEKAKGCTDAAQVRDMLGRGGGSGEAFEAALEKLCAHIQNLTNEKVKVERGKRYYRVRVGHLYAFIDRNGDILKPASASAPAKHSRGSIYDPNSWKGLTKYGPPYLR